MNLMDTDGAGMFTGVAGFCQVQGLQGVCEGHGVWWGGGLGPREQDFPFWSSDTQLLHVQVGLWLQRSLMKHRTLGVLSLYFCSRPSLCRSNWPVTDYTAKGVMQSVKSLSSGSGVVGSRAFQP